MPLEPGQESLLRAVLASPWPAAVKHHLTTPVGSSASGEKKHPAAWASLLSHLFPGPEYVVCSASYRETGVSRAGADREVRSGTRQGDSSDVILLGGFERAIG